MNWVFFLNFCTGNMFEFFNRNQNFISSCLCSSSSKGTEMVQIDLIFLSNNYLTLIVNKHFVKTFLKNNINNLPKANSIFSSFSLQFLFILNNYHFLLPFAFPLSSTGHIPTFLSCFVNG